MKKASIFLLITVLVFSCKDDGVTVDPNPKNPDVMGMSFTQSASTFEESYNLLQSSIDANANASSVDLTLNPTRIIFFGNPNLGTPLMQKNQTAGLDLPQKILVYQNDREEVFLGFNNTSYLTARHGLDGVSTLPMIQNALTNFSAAASGNDLSSPQNSTPDLGEGIITKISSKTFEDAYTSLQMAITNNPNLRIIAEVNHSMNAAGAGMELNPTRLIIFGNPNLGTPLMQNSQTTALDLPQKMLVWQDAENVVHVSYNDPAYLVKRHGISENEDILATISMALDNLSNVASTNMN